MGAVVRTPTCARYGSPDAMRARWFSFGTIVCEGYNGREIIEVTKHETTGIGTMVCRDHSASYKPITRSRQPRLRVRWGGRGSTSGASECWHCGRAIRWGVWLERVFIRSVTPSDKSYLVMHTRQVMTFRNRSWRGLRKSTRIHSSQRTC